MEEMKTNINIDEQENVQARTEIAEKKQNKAWLWIVIGVAVAAVIAIVITFICLNGGNSFKVSAKDFSDKYNETIDENYFIEDFLGSLEYKTLKSLKDSFEITDLKKEDKDVVIAGRKAIGYSGYPKGDDEISVTYCKEKQTGRFFAAMAKLEGVDYVSDNEIGFYLITYAAHCTNLCQTLIPEIEDDTIIELANTVTNEWADGEEIYWDEYGVKAELRHESGDLIFVLSISDK